MNVVVVMLDSLRPDYVACGGHPEVRTPHIDRAAGEGVTGLGEFLDQCIIAERMRLVLVIDDFFQLQTDDVPGDIGPVGGLRAPAEETPRIRAGGEIK